MKTTIIATLLATAVSASFAAAPTAALNHDPATYHNVTKKMAADYKVATAACASMTGNAKGICIEEAKAVRAHAQADAIAQYNNTPKGRTKALTAVADADFSLAKAKCSDMTGADKDSCMSGAASVHSAAVIDAKADRLIATGATTDATSTTSTTSTTVAVNPGATPATTEATQAVVVDNAADKTRNTASTIVEKTKEVGLTAADKTRNAAAILAGKTERATEKLEEKSSIAAKKTGAVVADSVITTKVKADIFKEPELKSMAIHVETEKGVVMLSGFVNTKADADKAVSLAKSVEGVATVQSAIKVK
jgi:osmotically-inducible protein OsmY